MKIRETVAGLAVAALLGLSVAPLAATSSVSYAAPTIFPYNAGAHILPFDGSEEDGAAGTVNLLGGDILLPPKIVIAGGAANNTNVDSYSCPAGPERNLVVKFNIPFDAEVANAPYANVFPCTGFTLDGDENRTNITMTRGPVKKVLGEVQADGRTIIFRGLPVNSYTNVLGSAFKVTGATESFEVSASASFEDGSPVYTTRVGADQSVELDSLEMRPQYIRVDNPAAEPAPDPQPDPQPEVPDNTAEDTTETPETTAETTTETPETTAETTTENPETTVETTTEDSASVEDPTVEISAEAPMVTDETAEVPNTTAEAPNTTAEAPNTTVESSTPSQSPEAAATASSPKSKSATLPKTGVSAFVPMLLTVFATAAMGATLFITARRRAS